MSKYKAKVPKKSNDKLTAQDLKDEKQFFKVAIIATLIIILVIWLIFRIL
ncbi:MAG TPA: hypothetical protein PK611_04990 [Saprospiraceae bacterium]|nr:hypothetical protein [Saprospiraceae bacterium]HRO07997.1 hypothetical protein [Saprospiraceae bacterium]HRO73004.1 hypothetical protein [Saprospiraceae bacterium]HRP41492.1 hypothetical protein [Saprospiraceae bacterium]